MPRKKESITLSIPPGTKAKLEAIADRLDIRWGKSPSISGLLVAIAQCRYTLLPPLQLDSAEIETLHRAANTLIDAGDLEGAKSVHTLLMDYTDLEDPIRRLLLEQAAKTAQVWRAEVDTAITNRQSFYLLYTNSQGVDECFTVRFGTVVFREKRHYIQAWCDETEGGDPLLRHNRCFRFDRIRSISPCAKPWRGQLDTINVELLFSGGLAKAYEAKAEDSHDTIQADGLRYVTRQTANLFWLCREVMSYGSGCEILAPKAVRSRFRNELEGILQQYQRESTESEGD